eukprot:257688-Chlamydomonas_euryale.AAC.1
MCRAITTLCLYATLAPERCTFFAQTSYASLICPIHGHVTVEMVNPAPGYYPPSGKGGKGSGDSPPGGGDWPSGGDGDWPSGAPD